MVTVLGFIYITRACGLSKVTGLGIKDFFVARSGIGLLICNKVGY